MMMENVILGSNRKVYVFQILKTLLPQQYVNMFINKLINNQRIYLELLEDGVVMKYSDFDDYIAKNT